MPCNLTSYSKSGGCAAKLSALELHRLCDELAPLTSDELLVGMDTRDDAAVYRLTDDFALVVTADFNTPLVDDPFLFGQVAAANALSDVYAMGGRPLTVLNLCMFPRNADRGMLTQILQGGLSKTQEAGALLVGGHTVNDDELKYGLSVNGVVDPKKYTPNSGVTATDVLILTKPLGSGVYISGGRRGTVSPEELHDVAVQLAELNRTASETMLEFGATGATDVTGFGLAGHALTMAQSAGIGIRFFFDSLPVFERSVELIDRGVTTSLTVSNRSMVEGSLHFEPGLTEAEQGLFWDPQTSGGLLFGVRRDLASECVATLRARGVKHAAIAGETFCCERPHLAVVRNA
jgi:selenide, water dikinase